MSAAATVLPTIFASEEDPNGLRDQVGQQGTRLSNQAFRHIRRLTSIPCPTSVYRSLYGNNFNAAEYGETHLPTVPTHIPHCRTNPSSLTNIRRMSSSASNAPAYAVQHPVIPVPYSFSTSATQPILIPFGAPVRLAANSGYAASQMHGVPNASFSTTHSSVPNASIALNSAPRRHTIVPATHSSGLSRSVQGGYPSYFRCNSVPSEIAIPSDLQPTIPTLPHSNTWQPEEPNGVTSVLTATSYRDSNSSNIVYLNDPSYAGRNTAQQQQHELLYGSSANYETDADAQARGDDDVHITAPCVDFAFSGNDLSDFSPQHQTSNLTLHPNTSSMSFPSGNSHMFTPPLPPTAVLRSPYTAVAYPHDQNQNIYQMVMVGPGRYLLTQASNASTSSYASPNLTTASGDYHYPHTYNTSAIYPNDTLQNSVGEMTSSSINQSSTTSRGGMLRRAGSVSNLAVPGAELQSATPAAIMRATTGLSSSPTTIHMQPNRLVTSGASSSSTRPAYLLGEAGAGVGVGIAQEGTPSIRDTRNASSIHLGTSASYQRYVPFSQTPVTRLSSIVGRPANRTTTIPATYDDFAPLRSVNRRRSSAMIYHGASHGARSGSETTNSHISRLISERVRGEEEERRRREEAADDAASVLRRSISGQTEVVFVRNLRQRNRRGVYEVDALEELEYESQQFQTAVGVSSRGISSSLIRRLPEETFDASRVRNEEQKECNICQMEYEEADVLRRLPCWHAFHSSCIDKWLENRKTCPLCRFEVDNGLRLEGTEESAVDVEFPIHIIENSTHEENLGRENIYATTTAAPAFFSSSPESSALTSALSSPLSSITAASWLRHIGNVIFGSPITSNTSAAVTTEAAIASFSPPTHTSNENLQSIIVNANAHTEEENTTDSVTTTSIDNDLNNSAEDMHILVDAANSDEEDATDISYISGIVSQLIDNSGIEDGGTGGIFEISNTNICNNNNCSVSTRSPLPRSTMSNHQTEDIDSNNNDSNDNICEVISTPLLSVLRNNALISSANTNLNENVKLDENAYRATRLPVITHNTSTTSSRNRTCINDCNTNSHLWGAENTRRRNTHEQTNNGRTVEKKQNVEADKKEQKNTREDMQIDSDEENPINENNENLNNYNIKTK